MNERSSLDIPGAEIYVGEFVGGFYQSGIPLHSPGAPMSAEKRF